MAASDKNDDLVVEKTEKVEEVDFNDLFSSLFLAGLGNLLEWYDFAVFGLLVEDIGANFFPKGDETVVLLEGFGVFAGAFLMRPLGGICFGYLGDKFGRSVALRWSIILMILPTFLLCILPNYETWGIFSTLCLVTVRLFQGLSVGGEWAGAMVYVYEISPKDHKCFFIGVLHSTAAGSLIGSLVVHVLHRFLTKEQMTAFGWRIPFALGVLMTGIGAFFRGKVKEPEEILNAIDNEEVLSNPVWVALTTQYRRILNIFLGGMICASYYLYWVFLPDYLFSIDSSISHPYLMNMFAMIVLVVSYIFGGFIHDYFHGKYLRILVCMFTIYGVVGFYILPYLKNDFHFFLFQSMYAICDGLCEPAITLWMLQTAKDPLTRYVVLGIAYNLRAILSGCIPILATYMATNFGVYSLSYIMAVFGAVTILNGVCGQQGEEKQQIKISPSEVDSITTKDVKYFPKRDITDLEPHSLTT